MGQPSPTLVLNSSENSLKTCWLSVIYIDSIFSTKQQGLYGLKVVGPWYEENLFLLGSSAKELAIAHISKWCGSC